jgi:His Kinase A (phospho-acceptor) domain
MPMLDFNCQQGGEVSEEREPPTRSPEVTPSRPLLTAGLDRGSHLGFVAHEFRNPLSTALWSAELLTRLRPDERAGERGVKLANLGARALGRIQLLMEDHLLCERLDAGGYPLRLGQVDVAALLGAVLGRLGLVPGAEFQLAPGLAGRGDRALLERAVEGVVAVAGRGGAPVRIAGAASGGLVRLTVRGAPVERLSDPVKGSLSDPAGRALALPMARRVAEVHGGALTADGEGYLLVFPAT